MTRYILAPRPKSFNIGAGAKPAESVYNLMPSHVLEDINVPFLLKYATIVDVHIKLPVIGKTVDAQRGVFRVLGQEAELLVEFSLDALGQLTVIFSESLG
jgi:hypothetical protein